MDKDQQIRVKIEYPAGPTDNQEGLVAFVFRESSGELIGWEDEKGGVLFHLRLSSEDPEKAAEEAKGILKNERYHVLGVSLPWEEIQMSEKWAT